VDSVVDGIFEGKMNMEKLLKDMAKSITKWLLNQQIQNFFKAMKGFDLFGLGGGSSGIGPGTSGFWAKGGAFDYNGVAKFARGDVFNRPTMFAYGAGKLGIMGEAGPEAIMPLKRGRDGKLGVEGGGSNVNVIVNNNASGTEARTEERTNPNGDKEIVVFIEKVMKEAIASGGADKVFRSSFGLTRQGY